MYLFHLTIIRLKKLFKLDKVNRPASCRPAISCKFQASHTLVEAYYQRGWPIHRGWIHDFRSSERWRVFWLRQTFYHSFEIVPAGSNNIPVKSQTCDTGFNNRLY